MFCDTAYSEKSTFASKPIHSKHRECVKGYVELPFEVTTSSVDAAAGWEHGRSALKMLDGCEWTSTDADAVLPACGGQPR